MKLERDEIVLLLYGTFCRSLFSQTLVSWQRVKYKVESPTQIEAESTRLVLHSGSILLRCAFSTYVAELIVEYTCLN